MGWIGRIVGLFLGVSLLATRARCQHVKNNVPRLKLSYKGKLVFSALGARLAPGMFSQRSCLMPRRMALGFAGVVPDRRPLLLPRAGFAGRGTVSAQTKKTGSRKSARARLAILRGVGLMRRAELHPFWTSRVQGASVARRLWTVLLRLTRSGRSLWGFPTRLSPFIPWAARKGRSSLASQSNGPCVPDSQMCHEERRERGGGGRVGSVKYVSDFFLGGAGYLHLLPDGGMGRWGQRIASDILRLATRLLAWM